MSMRSAGDAAPDGHRQVERDQHVVAGLNERDLVETEHAARFHTVGLDFGDDRLDRLGDLVDRQAEAEGDDGRRFGQSDVAELLLRRRRRRTPGGSDRLRLLRGEGRGAWPRPRRA